jgi:hypothetical protein
MSEADGTIPTTVTRKRKRGSGFSYPIEWLTEIGVVDLGDCSTGPASLHSVDENKAEGIDVSIGIADTSAACIRKVSIIRYFLL